MLHRSFKAGKCKTSLKLAVARIKLLKNKREVQLRQMKRDLAHLLETGQEKTAMIRVEHVVREEKTMAAYDFIDIYCELIVARLPIIESQKNCPIDLKEAVSSLMFASPRCADIPELLDVRKHFTAKYGKEFATSALELRPDCGVNRTVVENLSARAPDGQTKLKILTKIAQEQNVQWDPKAFGEEELKPSEDLLNGPQATEVASRRPVEPVVPQHPTSVPKPDSSYLNNVTRPSQSFQSSDSINAQIPNMSMHTSTELRASGGATGSREFEHLSAQNVNHSTLNRQNWNMEFKDATSAAQAAAESAERASLAARAAADLAGYGKVKMHHSTGLHNPLMQDQHGHMNERESAQGSLDRLLNSQETSRRRSSQSVSSKNEDDLEKTDTYCPKCSTEVEALDNNWQTKKPEESNIQSSHFGVASIDHHQDSNRSGHIDTMREGITGQSTRSSFSDDNGDVIPVSNVQKYGYDGGDQSFFDFAKGSTPSGTRPTKKPEESSIPSTHFGAASVDHHQDINIFRHTSSMDEGIRRQSSRSSSSFSDNNGDVLPVSNTWKYEYNGDEQSSFDSGQGNLQSGTRLPSFNDYPPVVFDEAISDDENFVHNVLYTKSATSPSLFSENLITSSPGKRRGGLLENTSSAPSHIVTESNSPSEFSERINKISPSKSSDLLPAAFDDSDGVNSESEEEMDNVKLGGIIESSEQLHKQNSLNTLQDSVERVISTSPEKQTKVASRKPWLHSTFDDSDSDDAYPKRHQEAELNVRSEKKNVQPSVGHTRIPNDLADDNSVAYNPVIEAKQQQQRPLQSSRHSLTKDLKTMEDFVVPGSPDKVKKDSETSSYLRSESGKELDFGVLRGGFRNMGYTRPPYRRGLLTDNSPQFKSQQIEDTGEKLDVFSVVGTNTNSDTQKASNQRANTHFNKEPSSRDPKTTFDSDSDDAEMVPRQTAGSRGKLGGRFSRRTRESPTISDISNLSMSTSGSRTTVSERDEFSQDFHVTETPSNSQIHARGSGNRRPAIANISVKHSTDTQLQSRRGGKDKSASANIPVEQQPQSAHLVRESSAASQSPNTETSKVLSWNKKPESGESSLKKASHVTHVHPKLPDYDTFAAHFESLRSRQ